MPQPVTDVPVYWFVILEEALDQGDLEQAARAQKELKRLGVTVTYRRRQVKREEEVPA
jgi:hypothetical protein